MYVMSHQYNLFCQCIYVTLKLYTHIIYIVPAYGCVLMGYMQKADWSLEWHLWVVNYIQCIYNYIHQDGCQFIWLPNIFTTHFTFPFL